MSSRRRRRYRRNPPAGNLVSIGVALLFAWFAWRRRPAVEIGPVEVVPGPSDAIPIPMGPEFEFPT